MQRSLTDTVTHVREGSDAIYAGTREIAAGNTDLSSRTEQQASALEETAASMEQLTATVKQTPITPAVPRNWRKVPPTPPSTAAKWWMA